MVRRILGLSYHYHDAAAALVEDGRVVAAAAEERFSRKKHDAGFPAGAVAYCLAEAGLESASQCDHVVYYEKPFVKFFDRILISVLATWPRSQGLFTRAVPLWMRDKIHIGGQIQKRLKDSRPPLYSTHHLSHAASAFYPSPFPRAAILTADGVGEWSTTTWGVGEDTRIELREEIRFPHSVGLLYSAITAYLGFRVNDAEWKVMGLAPYGEPTLLPALRRTVQTAPDGSFRLDLRYFAHQHSARWPVNRAFQRLVGFPPRRPGDPLEDRHRDLACSVQALTEELLIGLARRVHQQTGLPDLCLAGGVALNTVANWRILQDTPFERLWIQPAAGDDGGALGAALLLEHHVLGGPRAPELRTVNLGPDLTETAARAALESRSLPYRTLPPPALAEETAALLEGGAIVGWCQGRMEFGPRALGARSILADPRDAGMKDRINARVKYRESFRPFAPAVPRQEAPAWFEVPEGFESRFMLLVPPVRAEKREIIPAVTHADGTGRVQTTDPEDGLFHQLLLAFGRRTGVPVLLNTSFNVRGEPIVCTAEEAVDAYLRTGLDALVLGPCLVQEKPTTPDAAAETARSDELEKGTTELPL